MKFSEALELVHAGKSVRRACWHGVSIVWMTKGSMDGAAHHEMSLAGSDYLGVDHRFFEPGDNDTTIRLPVLNFKDFGATMVGWVPSQEDMFAHD